MLWPREHSTNISNVMAICRWIPDGAWTSSAIQVEPVLLYNANAKMKSSCSSQLHLQIKAFSFSFQAVNNALISFQDPRWSRCDHLELGIFQLWEPNWVKAYFFSPAMPASLRKMQNKMRDCPDLRRASSITSCIGTWLNHISDITASWL